MAGRLFRNLLVTPHVQGANRHLRRNQFVTLWAVAEDFKADRMMIC